MLDGFNIVFSAFLSYATIVVVAALVLIYFVVPQHGQTNIMVYIGVCSLLGSLTVCLLPKQIHLEISLWDFR